MLPDAEILRILCEVFEELGWEGRYSIKVNHRGVLDGIFEVCGVPKEKIRTISSAVDKLDKSPWDEVRKEMTDEKGLDGEIADRIWGYVQKKGGREVLEELRADDKLRENKSMLKGMDDMDLLFSYLDAFQALDKIEFNLSLARGLDYYTGLIYEVVTEGSAPPSSSKAAPKPHRPAKQDKANDPDEDRSNDPSVGVGSIAAGGRYDELVGMFSGKSQIPCVGVSLGVDRIFSITKARLQADKAAAGVRSSEVDVYVMAFGGKGFTGLLKERLEVCRILWDAGIKVNPPPSPYTSIVSHPSCTNPLLPRPNSPTNSNPNSPRNSKPPSRPPSPSPSSWAKTSRPAARCASNNWGSKRAMPRKMACWCHWRS